MGEFITPEQIKIGTRFLYGKSKMKAEVIDILKTYNQAGELVKTSYHCEHLFLGQPVKHEECATTIQRNHLTTSGTRGESNQ